MDSMSGRGVAIAILAVTIFVRADAWAAPPAGSAERFLLDSANHERATRGVPVLEWDDALAAAARRHAERMAEVGAISHQFPGEPDLLARASAAGVHFSMLEENVAFAPSVAELHQEWMNSPPHRENLLNPQVDSIGIAVVERGGELYAVQDFSRAVADLTIEQQEDRLGALIKARGLELLTDRDQARRACSTGRDTTGDTRAFYMLRFDTASLDDLPDGLKRTIESGRYRQAAVGACASDQSGGFTDYRVAVLLF